MSGRTFWVSYKTLPQVVREGEASTSRCWSLTWTDGDFQESAGLFVAVRSGCSQTRDACRFRSRRAPGYQLRLFKTLIVGILESRPTNRSRHISINVAIDRHQWCLHDRGIRSDLAGHRSLCSNDLSRIRCRTRRTAKQCQDAKCEVVYGAFKIGHGVVPFSSQDKNGHAGHVSVTSSSTTM